MDRTPRKAPYALEDVSNEDLAEGRAEEGIVAVEGLAEVPCDGLTTGNRDGEEPPRCCCDDCGGCGGPGRVERSLEAPAVPALFFRAGGLAPGAGVNPLSPSKCGRELKLTLRGENDDVDEDGAGGGAASPKPLAAAVIGLVEEWEWEEEEEDGWRIDGGGAGLAMVVAHLGMCLCPASGANLLPQCGHGM